MRSLALLGLGACVALPPALDLPDADPCSDGDGDGWTACTARVDCDDGDAAVHPGAAEVCADGVAQDCAGEDLACDDALGGNDVVWDDAGWTVRNDHAALTFDRQIDQVPPFGAVGLRIPGGSGAELLMTEPSAPDRYTGVLHWDQAFSYDPDDLPSFTIVTEGAAAVQVVLGWRVIDDAGGEQRYTIYPDGRIHRHDTVTMEVGGEGTYLATYLALAQARFERADFDGNPDGPVATGASDLSYVDLTPFPYDGRWLCAYSDEGDRVGVIGRSPTPSPGLRMTETRRGAAGAIRIVGLGFDWVRSAGVPLATYDADLLIHAGAVDPEDGPCAGVVAHANAFHGPPTVAVELDDVPEAAVWIAEAGHWDADLDGARRTVITPDGGAPSLAIRLRRAPEVDPVVLSGDRTLRNGADYRLHRDGATTWLFVRGPIEPGAPLAIEWP